MKKKYYRALLCTAIALASSTTPAAIIITSNSFSSFMTAVNNAPANETITFNLPSNSAFVFTQPITINKNLTFTGNSNVIFSGGGSSRLFITEPNTTVNFSDITFRNARAELGNGGAIVANGLVNVDKSFFTNNYAFNSGGAIHGNAVITNSYFASNIAGNAGGAVATDTSNLSIRNSTFYANTAANSGGAVNAGSGSTFIRQSTFYANVADNSDGAISPASEDASLLVENSTIYGNSARIGGGMSTPSDGGTITIRSSIIAGNVRSILPYTPTDIRRTGENVTITNSLIGDTEGNTLVNGINGNIVGSEGFVNGYPIASLLGPLQNNGGPTPTMELLNPLTNPAFNAGSNPSNLTLDQRGNPYLRTALGGVDIGAFEIQAIPEPSTMLLGGAILVGVSLIGLRKRTSK